MTTGPFESLGVWRAANFWDYENMYQILMPIHKQLRTEPVLHVNRQIKDLLPRG